MEREKGFEPSTPALAWVGSGQGVREPGGTTRAAEGWVAQQRAQKPRMFHQRFINGGADEVGLWLSAAA
jgi:hypothetical protein